MNGAQALVEMLIRYETRVVFGLPGDTSVDFYDALRAEAGRIAHVMARDERSAAFMADVYARLSGKPGVCEGPSGGGATYLLPGIVEAQGSSVALIALTTDNPLDYEAQGALTDLPQTQLYGPVTKWSAQLKNAAAVPHFVRRAFRLVTSGRPGAVHLALPKNVLSGELGAEVSLHAEGACTTWPALRTRPAADAVQRSVALLLRCRRPVIVAGGGAVSSSAFDELLALATYLSAPVATTINGKGAIAETTPLSLGVVGGNGGRPYANQVVQGADLVLVVGSKLNYVDTDQWRVPPLANPPTMIQIDVDPAELGNTYPIDEGLCADARLALEDLLGELRCRQPQPLDRGEWLAQIAALREAWRAATRRSAGRPASPIMPQQVIAELSKTLTPTLSQREREDLDREAVIICDPGTPTPYVAAEYELSRPGRWTISPRAQGGLGYAIPGVVGARLARPESPVVGLCGDGSFAMAAGDLATVARLGGPILLILFNNGCYGWIKALQQMHCESRFFSVDFPEALSYLQVAEGFGIPGARVTRAEELGPALKTGLERGEPVLIEVLTAAEGDAEPLPPVAAWHRAQGGHRG